MSSPFRLAVISLALSIAVSLAVTALPAPASPISRPAAATIKNPAQGILAYGTQPIGANLSVVSGWTVNTNWADLQPTSQGQSLTANNAIDKAIIAVRAYNSANPGANWRLKLRVYTGIHAPDWAKNIGGAPVTVHDSTDNVTGTVGRFWLDAFGAAYQDLQTKLAASYDSVPEIGGTYITRCSTVYGEPYIRNIDDPALITVKNFLAAGYTTALDQRCHETAMDEHQVWTTTVSSISMNPFQTMSGTPSHPTTSIDVSFNQTAITYGRASLGSRLSLENNSQRYPYLRGNTAKMYAQQKVSGAPLAYQTANASRIGDWRKTLDFVLNQGSDQVELPGTAAGWQSWPVNDGPAGFGLAHYAAALKANPVR